MKACKTSRKNLRNLSWDRKSRRINVKNVPSDILLLHCEVVVLLENSALFSQKRDFIFTCCYITIISYNMGKFRAHWNKQTNLRNLSWDRKSRWINVKNVLSDMLLLHCSFIVLLENSALFSQKRDFFFLQCRRMILCGMDNFHRLPCQNQTK